MGCVGLKKTVHTVNGKFQGCFYELSSGRALYLAHRTPGQLNTTKMAWMLDVSTLRKCETQNVLAVGVVIRRSNKPLFYLTALRDFFDESKSFSGFGEAGPQRGLPVKWFRINPGNHAETLARITTIAR
jgi:hypothetical protein